MVSDNAYDVGVVFWTASITCAFTTALGSSRKMTEGEDDMPNPQA